MIKNPRSANPPSRQHWITFGVWALRIAVGALFIYSGFVKLIDLWGFIYKIEEYLAVWGHPMPRSINLIAALLISATEFIGGAMLLTGSYKRSAVVILTAMMAFMLPLTAYIYIADPVSDCGCFGDALTISNGATLLKNIAITLALLLLWRHNRSVKQNIFIPELQWIPLVACAWFAIELGLTCYNVQPMIDFRQYPEQSQLNPDETCHNTQIEFIYSNGKETKKFTPDNIPSDTAWHFVDRIEPPASDTSGQFTIFDHDDDITDDAIITSGKQMLLTIPELARADVSYTYFINELVRMCHKHNIDFIAIIATDPKNIEAWIDFSLADYPCYSADDTQLKELARGNMALTYLNDGKIIWKRTVSSVASKNIDQLESNYGDQFPEHLVTDNHQRLIKLVRNLTIFLLALAALQWMTIIVIKKKKTE